MAVKIDLKNFKKIQEATQNIMSLANIYHRS